jgi:SAM-dependent methyltransferase
MSWEREQERILKAYKDMNNRLQQEELFFVYRDPSHFYRLQKRYWNTLLLLERMTILNLGQKQILDVGCGDGQMLREFLQWGAQPDNLAGIELQQGLVDRALSINPNLDIRCASATELPWPDKSFDIVCQHTVFSSILDASMKVKIASEMLRVLKPSGLILWYDFWLNPTNPQTRGIRPEEIKQLFPNCSYEFHRITLAPPIARILVPISWGLCLFLENLKIFNTHYLVAICPITI